MVVTFFGHRDASERIIRPLTEIIEYLIVERGVDRFLVGDSGAFDRMCESVLWELKKKYSISAEVVRAYMNDSKEHLLPTLLADGIEFTLPRFAIVKRNEWMIEKSDIVITYVEHTFGGAYKFKTLAQKKNKEVIDIKVL